MNWHDVTTMYALITGFLGYCILALGWIVTDLTKKMVIVSVTLLSICLILTTLLVGGLV